MKGRILRGILSAFTVAGLALAAYKYLDSEALARAWHSFSWSVWGLLLVLPALYLAFKAIRFAELMKPVSPVPSQDVGLGYAASQAASLLPGGVAMRAAMMYRLKIPPEKSSGPILANSASDQFILLCAGLFLCYYYPQLRPTALGLTLLLLTLVLTLSWKPARDGFTGLLGSLARRVGLEKKVDRFYRQLAKLNDLSMWLRVLVLTLLANGVSVAILLCVTGSLGFKVEPWPLVAAFVIPGLLGRLSPLPAGAGVTEAGMVGFLASQTAMGVNEAAVATLIFRMVDVGLPAFYGFLCYGLMQAQESAGTGAARVRAA